MPPQLLADTHIVVRWLAAPKRLTREQMRVLEKAAQRAEPIALSAITLLEMAMLVSEGRLQLPSPLDEFLDELQGNPVFQLLPLTYEVASEAALLRALRDPADRAIVATARVHRLRLVTSDQRIIASGLVPVID